MKILKVLFSREYRNEFNREYTRMFASKTEDVNEHIEKIYSNLHVTYSNEYMNSKSLAKPYKSSKTCSTNQYQVCTCLR